MTFEEIEEQMHINYDEGYKQGRLETIQKVCDYLKSYYVDIGIRYIRGYEVEDEIELFKKYMEEQQ